MTVIELISDEAGGERRSLLIAASFAGIANALVLALVNAASSAPDATELRVFAMYLLAIALYVLGARHTFHRSVAIVEAALHRLKARVIAKIERTDLATIERIGAAEIFDRVTENSRTISASAGVLANLLQSASICVFASLYLAYISPTAFVLLALMVTITFSIYHARSNELAGHFEDMARTRLKFFDSLTDQLRGFKELKYSGRRRDALRGDLHDHSDRLRKVTIKFSRLFDDNWIFVNCILFALLGTVVFSLPQYVETDASTVSKLVASVMFAWGPLGGIVACLPSYARSNQALREIEALEAKLDDAHHEDDGPACDPWGGKVGAIELTSLEYEYQADEAGRGFHVGPIDLTLRAGEVLFIVGGNGSGKSTLLKALTGLYPPTAGSVVVDGVRVDRHNITAYRELFTTIYADFHLFTRAYGLDDVDPAEVERLLVQMRLAGQTAFVDGRFTKRELSTGQRKRLAMILALLEDRPIYVFDEWAADQDPEFRVFFYTELVPQLRARGKMVLAVSHDDRYFDRADRVVVMESGQIHAVAAPASTPPA